MKLLRKTQLLEIVGISESTLDRMVKAGRFPPPLRIGKRSVAWSEAEVREWVADRAAERNCERKAG